MNSARSEIYRALTTLLQEAIWATLNRHRPSGEPDIWIFGSRRSGTTQLMQMIARNKGFKFCFEPTNVIFDCHHELEVRSFAEPLLLFYPDAEAAVREQLAALIAGRTHLREQWRFWRPDFHFRSDRIVFKVINSMGLIDWVEVNFNARSIYLVRHPISQALSVMRLGWGPRYAPFLTDELFTRQHLTPQGLVRCRAIDADGTDLERHVLTWCCENVALIEAAKSMPDRGFISYEQFVLEREQVVHALAEAYDFPNPEGMLVAGKVVSRSSQRRSTGAVKEAIRSDRREALVADWRTRVSKGDEARAFAILDLFGIDLYRVGEDLPAEVMRLPARQDEYVAP